ncbi:MAG: response regulator [Anaerolineales bacterium]
MKLKNIRVLIAEDDPLASELIQLRLEQPGIEIVGVASDGRQAVDKVITLEPDVLILDITMPELDGLQVLSMVKQARPLTTVIVLTAHGKSEYVRKAYANGASGFLTKQAADLKELPETIRLITGGEQTVVDKDLISAAFSMSHSSSFEPKKQNKTKLQELTEQEKLVLSLIAEGEDNKGIAQTIGVSQNTIKTHVRNIFTKLEVSSRTQAAIYAIRNGH